MGRLKPVPSRRLNLNKPTPAVAKLARILHRELVKDGFGEVEVDWLESIANAIKTGLPHRCIESKLMDVLDNVVQAVLDSPLDIREGEYEVPKRRKP